MPLSEILPVQSNKHNLFRIPLAHEIIQELSERYQVPSVWVVYNRLVKFSESPFIVVVESLKSNLRNKKKSFGIISCLSNHLFLQCSAELPGRLLASRDPKSERFSYAESQSAFQQNWN